jgi:Signal transduction histidine kinase
MVFLKKNVAWLTFLVSAIAMLIVAIAANKAMRASAQMIENASLEEMLALSRAASVLATADELDEYILPGDEMKPGYSALKDKLIAFTDNAGLEFTYFLRLDPDTNRMSFIIDNSLGVFNALSDPDMAREDAPDIALAGTANVVPLGSYSDGWEGYLTAFAPVHYSDGRLSNIVAGVDRLDKYIKVAQDNNRYLAVMLTISLSIVLGSCVFSMFLYGAKAKQAQAANEAKSSFLSRMSHEIRTPLNAIVGLCGMSIRSDDINAIKEYLGSITTSSQHLRRIIDDVLDLSKIESGKLTLEFIPASLRYEVSQIEDIVRPQTNAKGQTFLVEIAENVPDSVQYDVTHIRQVVVNLLSNAVKFTPDEGVIKLSVSLIGLDENRCNLRWCVEDNGIGISEQQQGKLFQAFEQADISTTRKYGGTGLGLSISKQLVEMMGGKITVESHLGTGSKFIFNIWLDLSDSYADDAIVDATSNKAFDLTGKYVLLVEDVEINQLIAVDMLEQYGAIVDCAVDGLDGYKKYLSSPDKYIMILMDIQMPVMDGYESTKKIRSSGHAGCDNIPIIAMTANVYNDDINRALEAGMNGHIGKPFDMNTINSVFAQLFADE